jgi:toxin CcdB
MSQFAVYRNRSSRSKGAYPLLLDVQTQLLEELDTRVVIPLSRAATLLEFPLGYLTPAVRFDGRAYALMTPQLASIARADLGPRVGDVAEQQRAITAAVDFLLRGF